MKTIRSDVLKIEKSTCVDCGYSSASSIISSVPVRRISETLPELTIKTLSFAIVVTFPLFSVKV